MNNQPLLTVLMPVYNAEEYLSASIESVLGQTYGHFQFLIINDGSTDGSEKRILSYRDSRIWYKKNEINRGLITTLNEGMEFAVGKYIVRMDADDICKINRFQMQVDFMEKYSEIGICGCCAAVIEKDHLKMKYDSDDESIRIKMLYQCHMLHPSVIIRKKLIDKHHLRYNSEFIHAEDYDLFYRIGKVAKLANLTDELLLYREHEGSVSRIYKQVQKDNSTKVIKHQFKDIGVNITESEITLLMDFMNARFDFDQSELYSIEKLLLRIDAANRHSKRLNERVLRSIFFEKWKDLLMNTTHFGIKVHYLGMNSALSQF
jgi:glycosyltransferase involved in cell wall biosynthesis